MDDIARIRSEITGFRKTGKSFSAGDFNSRITKAEIICKGIDGVFAEIFFGTF
jgi:hypothetical protein